MPKMTVNKETLLALLKCTKTGPASRQSVMKVSRMPLQTAEKTLAEFSQMQLLTEYGDVVEAAPAQRVGIAIRALQLGADFQRVCSLLHWTEFEGIVAQALEANGYSVMRNLRFKQKERRWEIDILGLRNPVVLCIDCKCWKHGWRNSASLQAVEAQIERTRAFANALPNYAQRIGLEGWTTATFIPLVLSLLPGPFKLCKKVPVVPVLQMQDFISELPFEARWLLHIDKKVDLGGRILTEFCKNES